VIIFLVSIVVLLSNVIFSIKNNKTYLGVIGRNINILGIICFSFMSFNYFSEGKTEQYSSVDEYFMFVISVFPALGYLSYACFLLGALLIHNPFKYIKIKKGKSRIAKKSRIGEKREKESSEH
jgi:hypothetical protein